MANDTFVDTLRSHAERCPERLACSFLIDGEHDMRSLTYGELDQESRRVATVIGDRCAPGARVVLIHEPGLGFVTSFFGCMYAGVTPVPVAPPAPPRFEVGIRRIQEIIHDARAEAVVASDLITEAATSVHGLRDSLRRTAWLTIREGARGSHGDATAWRDPGLTSDSIALLQYSSGSTGQPKGVIVRHRNLVANQHAIEWSLQIPADAVMVSWLPMYHDMGLIGGLMEPLFHAATTYLMSPTAFLERPARWLEAISRFRAYISGGPNFGYELCIRRVSDEEVGQLDLSSWRIAFCGAEAIRALTLRRFSDRFATAGFAAASFVGCYGLAEATLLVSGAARDDPKILRLDRGDLERGRATICGADHSNAVELVASGRIHHDYTVRIVDPRLRRTLTEASIGEIWVDGPSVCGGYWRRAEVTEAAFEARTSDDDSRRFLRTGDLGFLSDGQLFVTGRLKDVLIVRGRNVDPVDVEEVAAAADARLRPGGGVAFPVECAGEEAVGLIQEVLISSRSECEELARTVRRAVLDSLQLRLAEIHFVEPRAVLKTSSGKVRRAITRDALRTGDLTTLHSDVLPAPAVTRP